MAPGDVRRKVLYGLSAKRGGLHRYTWIRWGIGVVATMVYTFVVSFVVLKLLDSLMGLRVSEESEEEGLDLALHDERGYIL